MSESAHPYRAVGEVRDSLAATRKSLRTAGIVCLLSGAFWALYCIAIVAFGLFGASGEFSGGQPRDDDVLVGVVMSGGGGAYFLVLTVASVVGGIGLIRQPRWGRAAGYAAATAAIAGGSCGCVAAIGLAVWLFVLLSKPDAVRAFNEDSRGFRPPD